MWIYQQKKGPLLEEQLCARTVLTKMGLKKCEERGWRTFRSGVGCGCGAWALAGDLFTTCSDCSACTKQGPCERTGIDSEREGDGGHFGRKCAKDCGGRAFGERPGSPKAAETHKTKYGSGSLPTYSSSGMFVDELDSTESSEPLCRYV